MIPMGYAKDDHDSPWPPIHALECPSVWVLACQPEVEASWVDNAESMNEVACPRCRELEARRPA